MLTLPTLKSTIDTTSAAPVGTTPPRRGTISSLPIDSLAIDEDFYPLPDKELPDFDPLIFKSESEETVATTTHVPYGRFSSTERRSLSETHALIEGVYARVMDIDISPFSHAPFQYGYWPDVFLEESYALFKEWLSKKPSLRRYEGASVFVFQEILKRSQPTASARSSIKKYQDWASSSVQKLRPQQEIWFRVFSKCGISDIDPDTDTNPDTDTDNHILVLKVHKTAVKSFKLTLINVGYGAIIDREDPDSCRDLVITWAQENSRFYHMLNRILQHHLDVPDCYFIMRNWHSNRICLGAKRPLMKTPLCATETFRRCYKDFLGMHLYATWMSYWIGKELLLLETNLKTDALDPLSRLDIARSPERISTTPIFASSGGASSELSTSRVQFVPTMDMEKVASFLKATALTQLRYLNLSRSTISLDGLPVTLKEVLGCSEEGWSYVPVKDSRKASKKFALKSTP